MRAVHALVAACVLLALYALLAGSVSLNEAYAGFGCVGIVVLLTTAVHDGERRQLQFRPPPRIFVQIMLSLLSDSLRVGQTLLRAILRRPDARAGALVALPFRHGADRPDDAGRRGLVTIAASLAPNGFVLAVPRGKDAVLLHRLAPAPAPQDRDWLA